VRPPFAPAVRQFSAGPFLPSAVLPFRRSLEKKKKTTDTLPIAVHRRTSPRAPPPHHPAAPSPFATSLPTPPPHVPPSFLLAHATPPHVVSLPCSRCCRPPLPSPLRLLPCGFSLHVTHLTTCAVGCSHVWDLVWFRRLPWPWQSRTILPPPVRFHSLPWPRSSPVDATVFDSRGRSHLRCLWMPPAPSRNSIAGLLQSDFEGTFDPTRCSVGDAVHLSRSPWRASMHISAHAISGESHYWRGFNWINFVCRLFSCVVGC
jgi:hypothetical protein